MSVYYVNAYNITDAEMYAKYGPPVIEILQKYGAEVLAADLEAIPVEGAARQMNAIIRFPSEAAALQCYSDPAYQPYKQLRWDSTSDTTMLLLHGL